MSQSFADRFGRRGRTDLVVIVAPIWLNSKMLKAAIAVAMSVTALLLLRRAGDFLVVEHLHKADVIVVLGDDYEKVRYHRALQLLREGYSSKIFVDASDEGTDSDADEMRSLIARNPRIANRVEVCPTRGNSTDTETQDVNACVANASSVMLVTTGYHTRRALSIFQKRLPNKRWYVAATDDPVHFGAQWWQHRKWAKTAFLEWGKLLWWELVQKWR